MNQDIYDKTNDFFKQFPLIRMRKGQAIVAAEQDVPDIFWIRQGTIRMYHIADDGADVTLHVFRAPSFFPIMFYLSQYKGERYFQASEMVIARKASATDVVAFLKDNPDVLFDLTTRFANAITGLLQRIEQLSVQNSYQRVVSLLLYLCQKSGHQLPDGSYMIDIKLSHPDIAAWVGTARETVSHQMERLTKEGTIMTKDRQLVILNLERLKHSI